MRITPQLHHHLKRLRLDQPDYLVFKELIWTYETLGKARADKSFLQFCHNNYIIPRFIEQETIHLIGKNSMLNKRVRAVQRLQLKQALNSKNRAIYRFMNRQNNIYERIRIKQQKFLPIMKILLWKISLWEKTIFDKAKKRMKKLVEDRTISNTRKVNRASEHSTRITLIGNVDIDEPMKQLLSLGPNFAPNWKPNTNTSKEIEIELHRIGNVLKWRKIIGSDNNDGDNWHSEMSSKCPFQPIRAQAPPSDFFIDQKMLFIKKEMDEALQIESRKFSSNLPKEQRDNIKRLGTLQQNGTIRISVSDKGGEFTIIPQELDKRIALHHLSDTATYIAAEKTDFNKNIKTVKHTWDHICTVRSISKKFSQLIANNYPICPVIYFLMKTHKMTNLDLRNIKPEECKVRPIISGCDSPADRMSWLLVELLNPLIKHIPAHLRNSLHLLNDMQNLPETDSETRWIETFDVESLYTNIDNSSARISLLNLLRKKPIDLKCFQHSDIDSMLTACLECNIFRYGNQYYKQIRGLAMGNRLAPLLAISYMDAIEQAVIPSGIILYKRYIDDIIIIGTNKQVVDETYTKLHTGNIRLSREQADENGWLSFLDVELRFTDGRLESRWYRKPAKKNIILQAHSAHSYRIKYNIMQNMIGTAKKVSSENQIEYSLQSAYKILESNGYRSTWNSTASTKYTPGLPTAKIPFISDHFTRRTQQIFTKYGISINVVSKSPQTLKGILVRSRLYETKCETKNCTICPSKQGACSIKGAVYRINCTACNEFYIGETGRPLHIRIKEHEADIKHYVNRGGPLSLHASKHSGSAGITVKILGIENHTRKRKILEATMILTLKPSINRRLEMIEATKFLATQENHFQETNSSI